MPVQSTKEKLNEIMKTEKGRQKLGNLLLEFRYLFDRRFETVFKESTNDILLVDKGHITEPEVKD